jgi:hypothetical protein
MATKTRPAEGEEREFTVTAWVSIGLCKKVRARSAEEALDKANELSVPGLCHQCESSGERDEDAWVLNGLNDAPMDVSVEE